MKLFLRRSLASQPSSVPVWSGREGTEDTTRPPTCTSEWRKNEAKVIANKKEEMKDYMGQVKVLLAKYVPPNPQSMQQAFQSGKASLNPNASSGVAQIVFKDYALPGDQMALSFDTAAKKISSVKVNTYLDDPKDVVTLAVQFASLPDSRNARHSCKSCLDKAANSSSNAKVSEQDKRELKDTALKRTRTHPSTATAFAS